MARMPILGWAGVCMAGVFLSGCQSSRPAWGRNSSSWPRNSTTASVPGGPVSPAVASGTQTKPVGDQTAGVSPDLSGRAAGPGSAGMPGAPAGGTTSGIITASGSTLGGPSSLGSSAPVFANPTPPGPSLGNTPSGMRPAGGSTMPAGSSFPSPAPASSVPTMPAPSMKTPDE